MQSDQFALPQIDNTEAIYTALRELDALSDAVYKTGEEGFERTLETAVNADLAKTVSEAIDRAGGRETVQTRVRVIEQIKQALKDLPIVSVQIAIVPTVKLARKIREWASLNLGERVVVEIKTEAEVLGGAKITYNGRYTDRTVLAGWPKLWQQVQTELAGKLIEPGEGG